jgi:hypothetical protein
MTDHQQSFREKKLFSLHFFKPLGFLKIFVLKNIIEEFQSVACVVGLLGNCHLLHIVITFTE